MKYKALIIDDESKIREVLQIKLENNCPQIEVVDTAENVPEAFDKINAIKPDLVFLDISMPGKSGFDLLEMFEEINFEIIFATGYNEYALDALKASAVDYLLKPIKTEDLKTAVNKAKLNIDAKHKLERYDVLKHNVNNIGNQDTKIAIAGANSYEFIKVADILRCEGWQKYTKIHLMAGSCIVSSYNIGVYKDMLGPYGFYSCHKSHLINTKHITKYHKEGTVEMVDGSAVPVARRKKEEFLEKIVKIL